jgi:DNA-directed RNA polymerase specialized sigma24 family protein
MPVTAQPPPKPIDRGSTDVAADVAALHVQEVARLVAYLASSDRQAGVREAEDVAAEAFLEVASTWPGTGSASSAETYLFTCAYRIAVARSHLGRSTYGDAFAESMPAFGDQADLARLAVLQDALDQLPAAPRYAVLLREMCGFTSGQSAEIIGLPETTVELARDDALRSLVPVVESGTLAVHARRGPLSPDDFTALSRVLQHPDEQRVSERRQLAERLARGGPFGDPAPRASSESYPRREYPVGEPGRSVTTGNPDSSLQPAGFAAPPDDQVPFVMEPGWSKTTPLDAPLSMVDLAGTSTPIFDAISAWFATDSGGGEDSWAALDDRNWREANARAAAAPEVAGISGAGLPTRRPGANAVPSAAEVGPGGRGVLGESQRVDASQLRHRLDSYQQGVKSARRLRGRPSESGPVEPSRSSDPLFDPRPARRIGDAVPSGPKDQSAVAAPRRRSRVKSAPVAEPAARADSSDRDDASFRSFHQDYLPQVLAALLLEEASASLAAELAQTVFDQAYWQWQTLPSPQEWVRKRALVLLAERRGDR